MAASMRTLVLVGLVMAAFCVSAEATSTELEKDSLLDIKVKLGVDLNPLNLDVDVLVWLGKDGKQWKCEDDEVTVLDLLDVHLDVAGLLDVYLDILLDNILSLNLTVDLSTVKVIDDVYHLLLSLVTDKCAKRLKVLHEGNTLLEIDLDVGLLD